MMKTVGRLNREQRGSYLGNFITGDQIIVFYNEGTYEITNFELTNHYTYNNILKLFKIENNVAFNAIHYDGDTKSYYVKRFLIETTSTNKLFSFISEAKNSRLVFISKGNNGDTQIKYKEGRKTKSSIL